MSTILQIIRLTQAINEFDSIFSPSIRPAQTVSPKDYYVTIKTNFLSFLANWTRNTKVMGQLIIGGKFDTKGAKNTGTNPFVAKFQNVTLRHYVELGVMTPCCVELKVHEHFQLEKG